MFVNINVKLIKKLSLINFLRLKRCSIFFLGCLLVSVNLNGQDDAGKYIVVKDIKIEGNKKTKEHIILRELNFQIGDTLLLAGLQNQFERNKKWFINTDLFSKIDFNLSDWDLETNQATIKLKVKEAWYIYPLPIVELADRNFNIWWDDHNHTLDRINLGLAYYQNNFSGRRDRLVAIAQTGFTQKAEVEYSIPYFNKKKTIGVSGKVSFIRKRSIGYRIVDFKEQFRFSDDEFSLRKFRLNLNWTYRPDIRLTHTLLTGYHRNSVAHFVVDSLNSDFFGKGFYKEAYPSIQYRLRYDLRDINLYSMAGSLLEFNTGYDGAFNHQGPELFFGNLYYAKYLKFSKRLSTELIGKVSKTFYYGNPSFYHKSSLGSGEYIRGYEYYVLNGQDFAYAKTSLRFMITNKAIPISKFYGTKNIPFRLFIALNNDFGAIKENYFPEQNGLSGKMLWGKGIGLDFVFLQSRAIQVEYSMNHFGEKGLFLHLNLFN